MQNIATLLALTHPETEAFSSMALDLVVRLVKSPELHAVQLPPD